MSTDRKGDWMQTFTNRQFWPLDPRPEEIALEDIAHSLAMQVRYTGHAPEPYTIAQHSVLVSHRAEQLAAEQGPDVAKMVARWGLLHDASEAYLVDVARPVKRFLGNYLEVEAGVMRVVCKRFNLPERMPDEVRQADDELLATEARDFFPMRPADWHLARAPIPGPIVAWSRQASKRAFWQRYWQVEG